MTRKTLVAINNKKAKIFFPATDLVCSQEEEGKANSSDRERKRVRISYLSRGTSGREKPESYKGAEWVKERRKQARERQHENE